VSFTISQLFPAIETGLNCIGFLFGAGTSKEAGYPLTPDLTRAVVGALGGTNEEILLEILESKGLTYDPAKGEPNIEVLSDFVIEQYVATQDPRIGELADELGKLIVEIILAIEAPDLTHHVQFLEALKQRAYDTAAKVTILTTNYDLLFELAAGEVGIRIETGFDGPIRRYFDPTVFDLSRGLRENNRFTERHELHINLLKLHGSVSWLIEQGRVIESGLDLRSTALDRAIVLPRRRKVLDTLSTPFDQLFTRASRILGSSCKYLVSCGFSFGDKHINDQLIFPKLRENQIRLVSLCGEEPECLNELKVFPAYSAGFPDNCYIEGTDTGTGTDLWQFSSLVELLNP